VWSEVLREVIWVVAEDLPREAWPADTLVYTHQEVKVLRQIGQDTLAWVHATKQLFGARVVHPGYTAKGRTETPLNRNQER